jgi:DinB family protein
MTVDQDRAAMCAEMERARQDFLDLLALADRAGLRRRSDGTRWTNQQLLFHMVFGYLVVRALLILARLAGRLPRPASRAFARTLDAAHTPFHLVNYLGSCAGARIIPAARMPALLDHVIGKLQHRLRRETTASLGRGMCYPTTWDPFFAEYMTLAQLYHYPTQHFRYHRRQLTLGPAGTAPHSDAPGHPGP